MKYEQELNEAGEKWFDAKQRGDYAIAMAQTGIIFERLCQIYTCKDQEKNTCYKEAISEFYVRDFSKFEPNKQCFSAFFTDRFKYRQADVVNKNVMRTKKRAGEDEENSQIVSYNQMVSDDDHETTILDTLASNELTPEDRYLEKQRLGDLITLISGIWLHLHGKADNDRKRLYYKLFTTDTLSCLIKNEGEERDILYNRERDILNGIYYNFLDYFMEEKCRSVDEIFKGKIKQYVTDQINHREIEVRDLPIKNPVYVSYLANIEQIKVRDSAVSEQHKGYKELIKQLLNVR